MDAFSRKSLEQFIIRAKQATYIGGGRELLSYRLGSKDLQYVDGAWAYHDSYLGESDFIGQEIVYYQLKPVWGQNYFGYILRPEKITSAQAGKMLRQSLSTMYQENRFLGNFTYHMGNLRYVDTNEGDVSSFKGIEHIYQEEEVVYELLYHGGLLKA